eukprot:gb/GECH01000562.1/.p1 GENE.gb/GECH01000562.1/~~gb/GECH01000562.1/.p1  ORF type:complete len:338 (+),score=95.97 gb/GECH01000562.1/:1-1014(+)
MKPMQSPTFHHVLSIDQFSKEDILGILGLAKCIRAHPQRASNLLHNRIMAALFFEPSTRTRLSFETAMHRLGGRVIGFSESNSSSTTKGESLADTIRTVSQYADAIVIRHPDMGSAQHAANVSGSVPIINGGDGSNEHPTQTLLDVFAIQECQNGELQNLHVALVGDLKHGRTVHSLSRAAALFGIRLYLVAPDEELQMPLDLCQDLESRGAVFSKHDNIEEVIERVDVIYMTRLQKERWQVESSNSDSSSLSSSSIYSSDQSKKIDISSCVLNRDKLKNAKQSMRILHPLPRNEEIDIDVDDTQHAYYFQQVKCGVYVRQALLALLTSEGPLNLDI